MRRSSDTILTYEGIESLDEIKECIQEAEKEFDIRKIIINVKSDDDNTYYDIKVKSVVTYHDNETSKRKPKFLKK